VSLLRRAAHALIWEPAVMVGSMGLRYHEARGLRRYRDGYRNGLHAGLVLGRALALREAETPAAPAEPADPPEPPEEDCR
jgi:hypothetical protein